ncbi:hypothetical protein GCM10020331_077110 [Ectobacillus funiculus]
MGSFTGKNISFQKAKRVELYGEELSRLKENDTFDDMLASFDEVIVELN